MSGCTDCIAMRGWRCAFDRDRGSHPCGQQAAELNRESPFALVRQTERLKRKLHNWRSVVCCIY
jgi:hypothetical protein